MLMLIGENKYFLSQPNPKERMRKEEVDKGARNEYSALKNEANIE